MTTRRRIAGAGLALILFWGPAASARAEGQQKAVARAMRALDKGDKDGAADILEKALTEKSDAPFLNYHAGLVDYARGDYAKAKDYFSRAVGQKDKRNDAAAYYNAGNSLFQSARQVREKDPEQAVALMKEALNYYGRAIELNNADKDASYNYELTDKVIKVIKKKLPPQSKPQGGGSQENKKDQQQQQKQQQQQQKQQENQQQQNQQQEQKKQQQQQQEQQKKEGGEQENGQQGQQKREGAGAEQPPNDQSQKQEGAAPRKGELTEDEARMLVATYGKEGPRLDINKDKNADNARVLKNW
ncbi:MAG: hypothetical protein ACM3L6_02435 [Deltaproteobacteria bacterium]